MTRKFTSVLSSALVLGLAIAAPAAAGKDGKGGNDPQAAKDQTKSQVTHECENADGKIVFNGDRVMWPPNHKYQDTVIQAISTSDEDAEVTLTTTVTHDEYVADYTPSDGDDEADQTDNEEQGSGHTANDASPFAAMDAGTNEATTAHDVRSERSGRGDGRTYTFSAMATFNEQECSTTFAVEVPHDMRSDKAPAAKDRTGN